MRILSRARRPRRSDDRGGVVAIVAVLLSAGVLLGMGALAIDVGRIYLEREELQSGADAAAQRIAINCAHGRSNCASMTTANGAADVNAMDGATDVTTVCGRDSSSHAGLTACGLDEGSEITSCIGSAPLTGDYVEVRVRTESAGGSSLLPYSFAQTIAGEGTTVQACSRVAYGPPTTAGLGIAIRDCVWDDVSSNLTNLPPWSPGYPSDSNQTVLYLEGDRPPGVMDVSACRGGPSGPSTRPPGWGGKGGFAWVQDSVGDCRTPITARLRVDSTSGFRSVCRDLFDDLIDHHTPVVVPIFDAWAGSSPGNHEYVLERVVGFVVTGYHFGGGPNDQPSPYGGSCSGSARCIFGYFVKLPSIEGELDEIGQDIGLEDGTVVIKTIG